ncbi:hypothetical protein BFN67_23075 [Pseudaminobacter manganicus]|uniref:Uncharacterized protein n=2 Tax=Manganibacter manganicus TaxID=1873176 RepID=A0A1V8RLM7_9HYPH|nr:DUF4260 family protein [Pseudaminobacter manganicus]OQM73859.1 hypothetical protein BFN67_23075 [Pseudaminobacter manganicus]
MGWGQGSGAFAYNTVHIYAFGAVFIALGLVFAAPFLAALGALWLAHSGFDDYSDTGLNHLKAFRLRISARSENHDSGKSPRFATVRNGLKSCCGTQIRS